MSGTNQDSSSESMAVHIAPSADIRILRLNTVKTHRISGSFTEYRAYFELSATPSCAWSAIFGREWNDLNSKGEASIDGGFLVIQCPLQEIVLHLPLMKRAVAATNEAYRKYTQEQKTERDRQGDVSEAERSVFEEIAKFLNLG